MEGVMKLITKVMAGIISFYLGRTKAVLICKLCLGICMLAIGVIATLHTAKVPILNFVMHLFAVELLIVGTFTVLSLKLKD